MRRAQEESKSESPPPEGGSLPPVDASFGPCALEPSVIDLARRIREDTPIWLLIMDLLWVGTDVGAVLDVLFPPSLARSPDAKKKVPPGLGFLKSEVTPSDHALKVGIGRQTQTDIALMILKWRHRTIHWGMLTCAIRAGAWLVVNRMLEDHYVLLLRNRGEGQPLTRALESNLLVAKEHLYLRNAEHHDVPVWIAHVMELCLGRPGLCATQAHAYAARTAWAIDVREHYGVAALERMSALWDQVKTLFPMDEMV